MRNVLTDVQSDLAGFPTEAFERQTISDLAASMKSDVARVVVIGTSCAGKTTFARSLACVLSFPHIELDVLHWLPNWTERPADEFRALIAQALSQGCWVIDGNYAADLTWSRATTVIWLNYSFSIVLWRALMRTLRRGLTREKIFSRNRESLRMAFLSRESILWWVLIHVSSASQALPLPLRYEDIFSSRLCRVPESN